MLSFLARLPLRPPLRTFLSADEESVELLRRPSSVGMILSKDALPAELESESRLEAGLRPRLKVSLNPDRLHFVELLSSMPATDMVDLGPANSTSSGVAKGQAGAGHEATRNIVAERLLLCLNRLRVDSM